MAGINKGEIPMFQYTLIKDDDIQPLGDAVVNVLERVGIFCQNQEMLQALEQKGAKVDYVKETANFPKEMVVELIDQIRKENPIIETPQAKRFEKPPLPALETQVAQFVYDYGKDQRKSGNKHDFIDLIKLGNTLHPESVGHSLLLTDVNPMVEPLEAALLLAEYADNPAPAFAWNVQQVDYLLEMGDVIGISDWFTWGAVCFSHPLRFDKDVADRFVQMAKTGYSIGLTAMPVVGVTTPISIAGFIAVAGAEIVITWLAGRALNPDIPLGGSIWGGSMDMKTGEVSYSAFDAMLYSFALSEFLRKWTGKFVSIGGGEYCDAKKPGYYAAMEKAYKAMTIAAFTGEHPSIGQGMLEDGKTLCPVQLLLERELGIGVQLLDRITEVSPETLSFNSIFDVGFGFDKSYLNTDMTLLHFGDNLWCPPIMDRSGWNGADMDTQVLQKMQDKVNELIASYQKPDVDLDKLAKMREIVKKAKFG